MKKVVDDSRLIYKCCKMYYDEEKPQQTIADELGISRVTVSRLLASGRESGIVKIQVISPSSLTYSDLERDIEKAFGLKEVVVVEDSPHTNAPHQITALGTETTRLLEDYVKDGDIVGVSMGETLRTVALGPRTGTGNIKCVFVPLVGGINYGQLSDEEIHANHIVRRLSSLFGGECVDLFAPAMFSNKEVLEGFKNEVPMQDILRYYKRMKTIVVGVGYPPNARATMVRAGYLSKDQLDSLIDDGAVGDIDLQFYDSDGGSEKFAKHNDRVVGMMLKDLKRIENKIAVVSGAEKAPAVMGAIKGNYINILATDHGCAKALLNNYA